MPSFPIPVFTAVTLTYLFLLNLRREQRLTWLSALVLVCAVQSGALAGGLHYEISMLRRWMPIGASVLPMLVWYAFQFTALRRPRSSDLWHLVVPVGTWAIWMFEPALLDALLVVVPIGYGVAIGLVLCGGADRLVRSGLSMGEQSLRIWWLLAGALIVSGLAEALISLSYILWKGQQVGILISVLHTGALLSLGSLALSQGLESPEEEPDDVLTPDDPLPEPELWARVQVHMQEKKAFLDPDLTLNRLARALRVPAKTLSIAINRATGENVSRFVNAYRIDHATDLLQAGASVTEAMLTSGFNTKSNFNREFLRLKGCPPSKWQVSPTVAEAVQQRG